MDRDRAEPKTDADDSPGPHAVVGDRVWHDGHTPVIHAKSKQERKDLILAFLGCRPRTCEADSECEVPTMCTRKSVSAHPHGC